MTYFTKWHHSKMKINCTNVYDCLIGKRRSQMKEAVDKIEDILDVRFLIKKLLELEKLK
jgi:hypothetical protein